MTASQQALESLVERARRALRDNEPIRTSPAAQAADDGAQLTQAADEARTAAEGNHLPHAAQQGRKGLFGADAAQAAGGIEASRAARQGELQRGARAGAEDLIEQRMGAIRLLREFEPRCSCLRQRVRDLTQRLAETPADSLQYGQLLQRMAEAHAELVRLEGYIEEAQHVIRSTEWLIEMLSDPSRGRFPG